MNIKYDIYHNIGDTVFIPRVRICSLLKLEETVGKDSTLFYGNVRNLYEKGVRYYKLPLFMKTTVTEIRVVKGTFGQLLTESVKYVCRSEELDTEFNVRASHVVAKKDLPRLVKYIGDTDFVDIAEEKIAILRNTQDITSSYAPIYSGEKEICDTYMLMLRSLPISKLISTIELASEGETIETKVNVVTIHHKNTDLGVSNFSFRVSFYHNIDYISINVTENIKGFASVTAITVGLTVEEYEHGVLVNTRDLTSSCPRRNKENNSSPIYQLSILPQIDKEMSKVGKPIKWCITEYVDKTWVDRSHGWSATVPDAYIEMNKEYTKLTSSK